MGEPLRALIVEDSESDALLLLRELNKAGFRLQHERVETQEQMLAALRAQTWDVVLSDFSLPNFDAPRALHVLQSTGVDIPFIVVSGTVGEDIAVQTMKAGAHDYLLKGLLTRLGEAIRREMRDASIRRENQDNLKKIEHLGRVLRGIRNVNQLIVREKDPNRLLQQTCKELVNSRGYQAAWALFIDPSQSSVRIVAEEGLGDAFAQMRDQLLREVVPDCCQQALQAHGAICIVRPCSDCLGCLMRQLPETDDGRAAVGMVSPLESNGKNYGFVWVQVPEGMRTDEEELGLLGEVAGDIAFAFHSNRAELKRREAEDLFRLSFENAAVGKALVSPEGKLTEINSSFCQLLGYRREELANKTLADLTHQEDLPASQELVRSLLAQERSDYRAVQRLLRKDGEVVWTDVTNTLLRKEDGTPRHFISQFLDISESKRFEDALRKSETQLSNALQLARAGHWEYDVERDRFTFNDNFYRIYRTTAAEVGGYQMSTEDYSRRFCHPADAAVVAQAIRASMERPDREYSRQIEHRILYADGSVGHVAVRISVLKDAQGSMLRAYGVNQDITERKRYEAQIAQSDRLASMGMLAAGVAHEINNPLAYILYNLESIAEDLPTFAAAMRRRMDQLAERLGHDEWTKLLGSDLELLNPSMIEDIQTRFSDALHGTRRIRDIARGLGTFSRVEQDRLVPVNLMHVIDAAINMVFNEIKYRARLVKDYGKVASVTANDGRLSQVFLNLLINAAHAIPEGNFEGNEIRVRTWQEGAEVFAEVRDTGSGVAPEHLSHLFEPFFTTKKAGVGTGLGLPISKNIIEGYGGRIEVQSEVGKGTRFVVRLPVRTPVHTGDTTEATSASMQPVVKGRILIVDDEPGLRYAMVRMLKGNEVIEAPSGEEARRILESDRSFDLILCDMMMPTMSGVDLHEWMLEECPELADQVVFITGGAFTPKARDYLNKVSNIRLEKPFDVANFRKIVGELIVAYRAKRN